MDKLNFQHAKAVNLARRFSEQNENDLMMVGSHNAWTCLSILPSSVRRMAIIPKSTRWANMFCQTCFGTSNKDSLT